MRNANTFRFEWRERLFTFIQCNRCWDKSTWNVIVPHTSSSKNRSSLLAAMASFSSIFFFSIGKRHKSTCMTFLLPNIQRQPSFVFSFEFGLCCKRIPERRKMERKQCKIWCISSRRNSRMKHTFSYMYFFKDLFTSHKYCQAVNTLLSFFLILSLCFSPHHFTAFNSTMSKKINKVRTTNTYTIAVKFSAVTARVPIQEVCAFFCTTIHFNIEWMK